MDEQGNTPYSKEAQDFIAKVYPCEPPCDSYGVCSNCCDEANFGAGYNMGYRAAKLTDCEHGVSCQECTEEAIRQASIKLGW